MHKTVLSLTAAAAIGTVLQADSVLLESLTVTSTPLQSSELTAPEAVEIYTASDIGRAHVQSLYEFLGQQSSLITMPSYGNPATQKLDLHGYGIGNGYQNIVITLDGRRLNNVDMVPQLLSAISPTDIARIEIIKGGGIVEGGDGANAGVINIITKQGGGSSVTLYGGAYDTYSGAFHTSNSGARYSVSASGELYRTGGTRHINALQERDTQRLGNGALDLTLTPTETLELRLGVQTSRNDLNYGGPMTLQEYNADPAQPGSGYGYGAAPSHQKYDSDTVSAGLTYEIGEQWSLNLDAFEERKKSDFVTYGSVFHYDYLSLNAAAEYREGGFDFVFGGNLFDGTRDSGGNSYALANETTKNNAALYAMAQYRTGAHTLKAGYRFEQVTYDYSDVNTSLDKAKELHGVELGYNYRIDAERSLFVNYAHAYQAPDLDRFFVADYSTSPATSAFNGFIEPMTSDTVTVGYTALTATNKLKLSAYYTALENEIYYYSDPGYIASANTNIDRSHKYGLDLYDAFVVDPTLNFAVNYNYVQAIIDRETHNGEAFDGKTLPGVSNHNLKLLVNYLPTEQTTVTLAYTLRSDAYAMDDFGNRFSQKQESYESADLAFTYEQDSYTLFAKINNILNRANGLWIQEDAIYPVNFTTTAIAGLTLKY